MGNFFEKHRAKLNASALVFILVIPFFLYAAAIHGAIFQVKLFLALMIGTMLFVLTKG